MDGLARMLQNDRMCIGVVSTINARVIQSVMVQFYGFMKSDRA